jgi:hypothetical protein
MSSTNNDRQTAGELVPVKFSRLTRRGVLLGLSLTQLITLAIGGATLIGAFYAGGGMLLAYTAPIWVLAAALTWIPIAGRPIVEWLPIACWWLWRTTGGQLLYRRRIVVPRPVGTLALPGDMARLREYTDPDTGRRDDPRPPRRHPDRGVRGHPSRVRAPRSRRAERRVTSWGRVLATVCRSGRIATLQVLERTLPDSGTGLAEWWATHGTPDGSWAADTYAELIERAGPAGERHATTLSLSLDMKASARQIRTAGGGIRGAAAVLRQEMNTLVAALRSADLSPSGWLTPGQIAVMLRSPTTRPSPPHWNVTAGSASRSRRQDRSQSPRPGAGCAPTPPPRGALGQRVAAVAGVSGVLSPVLLSTGIQRSFSLICTPMRSDQAARDIRKKKVEHISDQAQRAKIGQIEDASQTAEYHDVLQQEADLTAGHGILRYTGLIAVSAPTVEELDAAVAAIEQAAIQASCETRLLVGQQAAAFTAAALSPALAAGASTHARVTRSTRGFRRATR